MKSLLRPKNSENKGNFGSPWRVIGSTVVIFIVSQILAAFIVEVISAGLSGSSPEGATGAVTQSAPAQFLYILLAEGGAAALVLYILKRRNLALAKIGLGRRPKADDLVKALIGFATFFALIIVVNIIFNALFPDLSNEKQDVGFHLLNGPLDYVCAFFALVILPPIGEEILMRGYLYSGLRSFWKFLPSMITTSLLFGLAHLQLGNGTAVLWAAGINTFVLSIVLVTLREKTGALYAGMLVHSLNNLIAFSVYLHR